MISGIASLGNCPWACAISFAFIPSAKHASTKETEGLVPRTASFPPSKSGRERSICNPGKLRVPNQSWLITVPNSTPAALGESEAAPLDDVAKVSPKKIYRFA
jgi:hypothetical protein